MKKNTKILFSFLRGLQVIIIIFTLVGLLPAQVIADELLESEITVDELDSETATSQDNNLISEEIPISETEDDLETTDSEIPGDENASATPQETSSDQETIQSEILEDTVNPNEIAPETDLLSSATSTIPSDNADLPDDQVSDLEEDNNDSDSLEIEITPLPDEVVEEEVIIEAEEEVIENIMPTVVSVAQFKTDEFEPNKEFTFELAGKKIPTKEDPDWTKVQGEGVDEISKQVGKSPAISLDDTIGALEVSGACSDPYFVVLIYRNPEDYDKSPSSYIFNKAESCVNGSYFYSISSLPKSLESGKFYLLIAGQGESGPWKPISALVPITINKENNE